MKQVQKTLVLIKPDAVERNLCGKIIDAYETAGLKIVGLKMIKADEKIATEHYKEHIGRSYFEELIKYITRSPLVAIILEGEEAIITVRKINGNTKPQLADEGTIRKRYGLNNTENSVHASDCSESAEREIAIWFS